MRVPVAAFWGLGDLYQGGKRLDACLNLSAPLDPLAILAFAHTPLFSPYQTRVLLDLAPTLAAIVLTLASARRAPLALTLYLLAVLYVITSEPVLHIDLFVSAGRYLIAAVPLFALAGGWLRRSEWVFQSLYWSGTLLQAILAVYFLGHGFIV